MENIILDDKSRMKKYALSVKSLVLPSSLYEQNVSSASLPLSYSRQTIVVALIKVAIAWYFYLKHLSFDRALIGGWFSSIHTMLFTGFPWAEQKFLLNPLRELLRVQKLSVSKRVDIFGTLIHKTLNLGIVTCLLNWENWDFQNVLVGSLTSASLYTLIKGFWKIHFDYQFKQNLILEPQYHWYSTILEVLAFALMPPILLRNNLAIIMGGIMALLGILFFLRRH